MKPTTSSDYRPPYHKRYASFCDTCGETTYLREGLVEDAMPTCDVCGEEFSRDELGEPSGPPDECGERHHTLADLKEAWGGRNGGDGDDD